MKKVTIKITPKEFIALHSYCKQWDEYIKNTSEEFINTSNILISEIYEQLFQMIPKWHYFSEYKEYSLKLRFSEARSLAIELINCCPDNTLHNILCKLDKSLNNNNCNLKSLVAYGT